MCATCFNVQRFGISPTEWVYGLYLVLRLDSYYYFVTKLMCLLGGKNQFFKYFLHVFRELSG
jgi:hypothetical protein